MHFRGGGGLLSGNGLQDPGAGCGELNILCAQPDSACEMCTDWIGH